MKKLKIFIAAAFAALSSVLFFQSCDDSKKGGCTNKISKTGLDDSHNNGQNCMSCHVSGGSGEGCFVIAGSVYDNTGSNPINSGTVNLHTGPNGTGSIAATLQVDGKGNFYTTDQVNFSGGLYPAYINTAGKTVFMGSSISFGQCNSGHGVSTNKIIAP